MDHLICEHAALMPVFLTHRASVNSPTCDGIMRNSVILDIKLCIPNQSKLRDWATGELHNSTRCCPNKREERPPRLSPLHIYLNFHGLAEVLQGHPSPQRFASFTPKNLIFSTSCVNRWHMQRNACKLEAISPAFNNFKWSWTGTLMNPR